MARYYKKNKKKKYNRKERTKEIKKFAYNMGLIKRGLKNPESEITKEYNKGLVEREKKDYKKRTLF